MSSTPGHRPRDIAAEVRSDVRRHAEKLSGTGPIFAGVAVVAFLMVVFIVLDYVFNQDPHRVIKVGVGALALGLVVIRPRFGLLLLPVVTPFLLWVPPTPIPGLNALNVLLLTVFGSYALGQVLAKRPFLVSGRLGPVIGALLGLAALSIIRGAAAPTGYGYDAHLAVVMLIRAIATFAAYFIVLSMARGAKDRRLITWAVLVGLLLEALATAKFGRSGSGQRAVGSIGQSNELGGFLALFSLIAAALMIGARSWYAKLSAAVIFGLGCFGIMLSLSRGSMLALMGGLAIVAWRSSRWVFGLMVVVLLAAPLWVPDYVIDRITESQSTGRLGDDASVDDSSALRLLTWRAVIEVVTHHPIDGVGFMGLQFVLPDVGEALGLAEIKDSAHNTYLRIVAELGVFGLLAFVLILWKTYQIADRAARQSKRRFDRAIAIGMCGSVAAMAISCAFGDRFWSPVVVSNFWVMAAVIEDILNHPGEVGA